MHCPECAAAVSPLREFCPQCGAAIHRDRRDAGGSVSLGRSQEELKRNRARVLVIGAALLLVLGVGKASWFGATFHFDGGHRARGPAVVQADQLFRAYRSDPAAAEARYGGREMVVTGQFLRIAPDGSGDPDLRLKTSDPDAPLGIDLIRASQPRATELRPGQTVTVSCERVDRTGEERWLRNCAIQVVRDDAGAPAQAGATAQPPGDGNQGG